MDNKITRCAWCGDDPLYRGYHDNEWGKDICDEQTLFEFLVLESAQAGLSWITILRKKENYRKAYKGFDPNIVARFNEKDVERLLADDGIIRNRRKIESSISNSRIFLKIQNEYGSFRKYLLSFFPDGKPIVNHWISESEAPCSNEISDLISKDLKKRGFRFFGTVICYSFLQAVGLIDDHIESCSFKSISK